MARRRKRWLILIAVVVIAVAAVAYAARTQGNGKGQEEKGPEIPTLAANIDDVQVVVREVGTVEPEVKVEIKSNLSGKVVDLPIRAGDVVTRGQLIARIEPDVNQAQNLLAARFAPMPGAGGIESQVRTGGLRIHLSGVGGGVWVRAGATAALTNTIVYFNTAASSADIANAGTFSAGYSCSPALVDGENGNKTADPEFAAITVKRQFRHVFRHGSLLETRHKTGLRRLGRCSIMKTRHDLPAKLELDIARVGTLGHILLQSPDFLHGAETQ